MLRNTFLHLPGVGPKTEARFWSNDWHTWDDLLGVPMHQRPACLLDPQSDTLLRASLDAYAAQRWRFFEQHLPGGAKWRAFGALRNQAVYVDIETDGSFENAITVLGVYDGAHYHAFVADENLEEGLDLLEQAALVVTYNGTGFDMPIIRQRFPYNLFNHVHVDLMWPLRRLGFKGGLKSIERQLGLARSDDTAQMSGWDAVVLWREYKRGSAEALSLLLRYNEEDVRNLMPLMEWVYGQLCAKTGITLRP